MERSEEYAMGAWRFFAHGDNKPSDESAQYVLPGLPTPRVYARFPFLT